MLLLRKVTIVDGTMFQSDHILLLSVESKKKNVKREIRVPSWAARPFVILFPSLFGVRVTNQKAILPEDG